MIPDQLLRENGPFGSILVTQLPDPGRLVTYQMDYLVRHQPAGLLPCYLRYRSGQAQICLETSGLKPLDEAFAEPERSAQRGRAILASICSRLLEAEDHLLPAGQFMLHPSLIFVSREEDILLGFWPVRQDETQGQPEAVLAELVEKIAAAFAWEHDDARQAEQAARTGLHALSACLDPEPDRDEPAVKQPAPQPEPKRAPRGRRPDSRWLLALPHAAAAVLTLMVLQGWYGQARPYLLPALGVLILFDIVVLARCLVRSERIAAWLSQVRQSGKPSAPADSDQTVLLAGNAPDFRMAMLCEGQPGTPEEQEGVRAFILADEFVVGRDARKTDLCLPVASVGRVHARICRRAGSFFICDLGSANGTCLDGRRLQKHAECLLPDACLIQFADQVFHFRAG